MNYDFIVLGSGISGLSTALMLGEKGYRVALVGTPELMVLVGGSSSGILTYHMDEPFIDWSLRTLDFYKRIDGKSILKAGPSLWFSPSEPFVRKTLNRVAEAGLKYRILDSDQVRELPFKTVEGEIIAMAELYTIAVGRLFKGILKIVGDVNVEIVEGWGSLKENTVTVRGETLRGEVIVAAGPWSKEIVNLENTIIYKCQAVRLEEPQIDYTIIDDVKGYYASKTEDNTIALGDGIKIEVKEPEEAFKPDNCVVEEIIRRAESRGIISKPKISYTVSAPCIGTGDSYPLVGEVKEGVYVITALDGVGFSIGPALAELLVEHLTRGAKIPGELDPKRNIGNKNPIEPVDPP